MGRMGTLKTEVDPVAVGFDAGRLEVLDRHFQRYVDDGLLPGWLVAISRHGQLAHVSAYGRRDLEAGLPVETDTIWRIYSMTKPITAVTALVAYEQGLFELGDPVRWYIPSFKETKVWRSGSTTAPILEPITEELRVWHLFAHTAGLTYGFMQSHPVDALYRQAGFEWGVPDTATDLAAICDLLAALPLVFQPGTEWQYGMGLDVLGRLVEVVSGVPFAEFMEAHVLDPLGMTDTVWLVGEDRADRLAALYAPTPGTKKAFRYDAMGERATTPPVAPMGGGGLCATASDYVRFAEMLRGRGELDGVRILAPKTVELMANNHLPGNVDLSAIGRPLFSETTFDGVGFGLGVSVTIDPVKAKVPGSVGDYGWGGAASTSYWVDPVQDMTVVFMTQLLPSSTHALRSQLKQLVHSALVDPGR
jgi:CubicO group peptidase (beta-lactamase class C family)